MSDTSTEALRWLWDNDPERGALKGTRYGAALLIVEVAAPMRWGGVIRQDNLERAARSIEADPGYLDQLWNDARNRIDAERGSYAILGERAGLSRRIGLVVPTFLSALVAVAETELFFAAPRELLRPLLPRLGLVVVAPPIEIPPLPIAALWHERYQADPAHRFLRTLVIDELRAGLAKTAGRARGLPGPDPVG